MNNIINFAYAIANIFGQILLATVILMGTFYLAANVTEFFFKKCDHCATPYQHQTIKDVLNPNLNISHKQSYYQVYTKDWTLVAAKIGGTNTMFPDQVGVWLISNEGSILTVNYPAYIACDKKVLLAHDSSLKISPDHPKVIELKQFVEAKEN